MPTATKYFDFGITNGGPLTTTWTAPASCATDRSGWYIEDTERDNNIFGKLNCANSGLEDCIPSGKELAAKYSKHPDVDGIYYYSPGLHCPSGWTTAGTIQGASDGVTSGAGIFTAAGTPVHTVTEAYDNAVHWLNWRQVFEGVLDPSETLAWCCPSGFKAKTGGNCISTIGPASSYNVSTYCNAFLDITPVATVTSFDGTIYTQGLESFSGVAGTTESARATFTPSDSQLIVTQVAAVALIHQESDVDSAAAAVQPAFGTMPVMALAACILARVSSGSLW